jgi:TonB family protein
MNRYYFSLAFTLLIVSLGLAQSKSKAVKLYDAGNEAFASKDYHIADSLFTLSLDLEPHPDSYYNRAVCRRKMNDFKGYCLDLEEAAELNDHEAGKLYWKQCAKRDTAYKKENGDTASAKNFDVKECIVSYRYNTDFTYDKNDKEGRTILSKARIDNVVFYRACKAVKGAIYKGHSDSLIKYIKTQTDFMEKMKKNHWAGMSMLDIRVNEKGKVAFVEVLDGNQDASADELIRILLAMPEWEPAIFQDRPVKFQGKFHLICFDNSLSISSVSPHGERFTVVETMPEFPGGPMEMMKFIQKNLNLPLVAKEAGLKGKCFLRFVINADGHVSDIEVLKGVTGCSECDKEAKRVVSIMPVWKPGTQNGKPVPVFFNLPINFQLR